MRNERDMSKVLNCLHAKEGFEKASSIGDDPMIGHQDRFVAWNEGNEASCHLVRPCSCIAGQRTTPSVITPPGTKADRVPGLYRRRRSQLADGNE
jgi:hypothetical protein